MAGGLPRVLALVVDFRTTADAEALTCQIAEACHDGLEVTVAHVDNGNAIPVTLSAAQIERGIRLIRVGHNGGYAAGIRQALAQVRQRDERYDAFWLLNSDLEIEPECLGKLLEVLELQPRVAAVGPTILEGDSGKVWGARGVVSPLLGTTAMTPWPRGGVLPRWSYIPGCSLLVRAEAYDQVGGIPDRYGMFYEETHLCVQLQKHGWDLWVEPSAIVRHGYDSRAGGIPAPYQAFYYARNNLYFWKANFGIPPLIQFPRTLFVITRDLVLPLRQARSISEIIDRLGYIGMGLLDGFSFFRRRFTYFERKYFELEPRHSLHSEG